MPGQSAADIPLALAGGEWRLGNLDLGGGVLTIQSDNPTALKVNGSAYRGALHFIPVAADRFDTINDVDVEGYLKGVVATEMYRTWRPEAFKSQAVAARTYVLYVARTEGVGRAWDVYDDQRSQVYGGIGSENAAGDEAVDATAGIVLTYGSGEGKIFKAYFGSCCGGVSQAAADAFPGDPYIIPLSEQNRGPCCSASKYFNWGPITISKAEITRRFHLWAQRESRALGRPIPESNMGPIYRIELQGVNRYGRPNRVLIVDSRGAQFSIPAEEMREAINSDDAPAGSTLPSSYCKINGGPNSDSVTFFDGHGYGHGVGMCQWCAEAQAESGEGYQQILLAAYPAAKLVRAY